MNNGWSTVRLGEVISHRKEFIQIDGLAEYKRCRVQLHTKGILLRDIIEGASIKTKSQQVCRAGEFLVAEIDAKVGGFGIVPDDLDGAIVSSHYFLFTIDDVRLTREFLGYFVRTPAFREQVGARGSTNYAAIRPSHVLNYEIPLPPLAEQRRIVAKIEQVAAKIDEARGLRRLSEAETAAFLGSHLNAVSASFEELGVLANVLTGKPRNGWSPSCDNAGSGTPVLTLSAVTGFRYDGNAHKRTSLPTVPDAHYWLKVDDLLVTRSNTPELVGHAAMYDGRPEPCIYPDLMMRVPLCPSRADTRFTWWWLQTPVVRDFIRGNAKGTSPTMKKISQGTVMGIPFPTQLALEAQRSIVAYLDGLQAKADRLKSLQEKTAAELDALLPSILDKAFKGELL